MAVPILTQIKNSIRSAANYIIGGFRYTSSRAWAVGVDAVYSPVEQENAIKKGYNANSAVYSIVKKYSKKAASIERYLENKATEEAIENHPLTLLLQRPNEKQSHYALFKTVYTFYKVCGEAFIWLNRGDVSQQVNEFGELEDRSPEEYVKQPVIEMHSIPSNQMAVIPDPLDPFNVIGYQLQNNPTIKFRKEDIIHWMDVNLEWDEFGKPQLRGMSPLKPGSRTLQADLSATDSMVRMFQNDGAKGAIVNKTIGAKMSPTQQSQLQTVVDTKINNKDIKNAIAALEGDWTYLDFGLTAVDMDTLQGREFIYKELCFLLDVPYGFFDSHTPYAEKQLAARDWISNSIKPDVQELDNELQRMLFPAFGLKDNQAKLCSDFDNLPELQEDKAKLMEWLNKAPLTGNQRLEALEYEKSTEEGMDVPTCSENMTPIQPTIDPMEQAYLDLANQKNVNGTGNREKSNGALSKGY